MEGMNILLVIVFIIGYAMIVFETKVKVNKAAISLLMCGVMWGIYKLASGLPSEILSSQALEHLGASCEILIFLIGAITIVTHIDEHDGFYALTKMVGTQNKVKLLWFVGVATFFMSSVLDNMTTTIVMVMLLSRLIYNHRDLCLFASVVVIAANSGGAWSPIGDVTTIMLWMNGNVTTGPLIKMLLLPCLVSMLLPLILVARRFKTDKVLEKPEVEAEEDPQIRVSRRFSNFVLILGVLGLLSVPILKEVANMPPYLSVMLALGVLWLVTDVCYNRYKRLDEKYEYRVSRTLRHIDMPTILFFFGILMAVGVLESSGVLGRFAASLDSVIDNVYVVSGIIGALSSVVDNVPLVAACMGMYPVPELAEVAATANAAHMMNYVQDGLFWQLISYCAGVGGSMLIIGSAAGVVAMGLQKISFGWYLKNVTFYAMVGYLAGILVLWLQNLIF